MIREIEPFWDVTRICWVEWEALSMSMASFRWDSEETCSQEVGTRGRMVMVEA